MKLRSLKNLPLLMKDTAELIGKVEKAVIDDSFKILYLVIKDTDDAAGMLMREDFELTEEAAFIWDKGAVKSYAYGEELSVYDKKLGDIMFDEEGKELGVLSDFVIDPEEKLVRGVEISSGAIKDILDGRMQIALSNVRWASDFSAVVNQDGGDIL